MAAKCNSPVMGFVRNTEHTNDGSIPRTAGSNSTVDWRAAAIDRVGQKINNISTIGARIICIYKAKETYVGEVDIHCANSAAEMRMAVCSRSLQWEFQMCRPAKVLMACLALSFPTIAMAQPLAPNTYLPLGNFPETTGAIVEVQPNTTGNDLDVIIAPGRTGASTITTDSAAGGNSEHPERPVPNGSANGGSH